MKMSYIDYPCVCVYGKRPPRLNQVYTHHLCRCGKGIISLPTMRDQTNKEANNILTKEFKRKRRAPSYFWLSKKNSDNKWN